MAVFLILMVIGLVGLAMMALPAFGRRGSGPLGHSAQAGHAANQVAPPLIHQTTVLSGASLARLIPSPRLVCSLLALYGAFGYALVGTGHLAPVVAAMVAAVPAAAIEKFAVTPLWRLLFRFQGQESSPLEALIMGEAKAVTRFRNGRGLVSVVRDGRLVQFAASVIESQAQLPIHVGERLRVEDVDASRERLTVSVAHD